MGKEKNYFAFSQETRNVVKKEQNYQCAYCGNEGCLEVHHIVPSSHMWKMKWNREQIQSRENAVALCGGEGNCHETFDILARDFGTYFDDVMEDEGRPYEPPVVQEAPSRFIAPRQAQRVIAPYYGFVGDDD